MGLPNSRRTFLKQSMVIGCTVALPNVLLSQENSDDDADIVFENIHTRRSVRKFKPTPVPEQDIQRIIDAARMAPTSGNQQPWKFLVISKRETIAALKDGIIESSMEYYRNNPEIADSEESFRERVKSVSDAYMSAPVYIVVLTDNNSKYASYNDKDGPLAAGYLLLAARALGYGTVFITDSIPESVTKEVLNIPDHYTRVCITPVGVPEEWPETPEKKDLESFIAYETLG